jgi:AcrR family transcriptional regulator
MVIRQRAMLDEDKLVRRQSILSAAAALFMLHPDRLASVEEVAREAGLAKGTLYLYFKTKEEIYLAVHEQQTQRFFDTLEALLLKERRRPSLKRFNRSVIDTIRQHPGFLRLGVQCPEFERNADFDAVAGFKGRIGARLEALGGIIETIYPALKTGEGALLLIRSYALMLGLWQLVAPSPVRERLNVRDELALFRLEYFTQLEAALFALWRGTVDR